jgi:hypothetical protein
MMMRLTTTTMTTEKMTMELQQEPQRTEEQEDGLGAGWRDGFFEEMIDFEEEDERKLTKESQKRNQQRRVHWDDCTDNQPVATAEPNRWSPRQRQRRKKVKATTEDEKEPTTKMTKSQKRNQRKRRSLKPRVKIEPISWDYPMMLVTARWVLKDYLKKTDEEKQQMTDDDKRSVRAAWKTMRNNQDELIEIMNQEMVTMQESKRELKSTAVEADRYDCDNNQPVATTWLEMENKKTEEWREFMMETALKKTEEYEAMVRQEKNVEELPRKGWTTMELITMKDMEWKMEMRTRKRVPPHEKLAWNTHQWVMRKESMESKEKTINLAIHRKKYKRVLEEITTRVEAMGDCVNNQPEATAKESKTKSKKKRGRSKKHKGKRNKTKRTEALDEQTWTGETTTSGNRYFWNRGRPPERSSGTTGKTTKQPSEKGKTKGYYWYRGRPPEIVQ